MYDIAVIGGGPGGPVRRHPGQGAQQVGTGGQRGRPGQSPLQDQPHRQLSGFLQCDRSRTAEALPHPRRTDGGGAAGRPGAESPGRGRRILSEHRQRGGAGPRRGAGHRRGAGEEVPGRGGAAGRGSELLRYLRRDALPGQGDRSGGQNRRRPPRGQLPAGAGVQGHLRQRPAAGGPALRPFPS